MITIILELKVLSCEDLSYCCDIKNLSSTKTLCLDEKLSILKFVFFSSNCFISRFCFDINIHPCQKGNESTDENDRSCNLNANFCEICP